MCICLFVFKFLVLAAHNIIEPKYCQPTACLAGDTQHLSYCHLQAFGWRLFFRADPPNPPPPPPPFLLFYLAGGLRIPRTPRYTYLPTYLNFLHWRPLCRRWKLRERERELYGFDFFFKKKERNPCFSRSSGAQIVNPFFFFFLATYTKTNYLTRLSSYQTRTKTLEPPILSFLPFFLPSFNVSRE